MTDEEWNLSKFELKWEGHGTGFYPEEKIKEFIKRLKEEISRGVKRNNIFPLDWCFDSIDTLAGDELTK